MTRQLLQKWCLLLAAAFLWLPAQQVSGATISNTARFAYTVGGQATPVLVESNTVAQVAASAPTPAVVRFYNFAPGAADANPTPVDGGQCADAAGSFSPLARPALTNGTPLPTSPSLPIRPTELFHAGEPVFIELADANRDTDPTARDLIDVAVTTSTGDQEVLRLLETGISTGVFATVIQSVITPPAPIRNNCVLSVINGGTITVAYVDAFYADDIANAVVLVDPFGIVFDSRTGAGISGARVTLINVATGQPAVVFGDDGVSAFPSSLVTGQQVTDASGRLYTFPEGGFRFPFIAPGTYRLQIEVPAGYTIPSTLPLEQLQGVRDAQGNPYALVTGSFGEPFTIPAGSPAVNIDVPADPAAAPQPGQSLVVEKTASRIEATAGDFVQYTVAVRNTATIPATTAVLRDVLPVGFRYRGGSSRRDGQRTAEPTVSADGRTLSYALGTLAASATTSVAYVAELTAGVRPGDAVNLAAALAGGGVTSNQARAAVRVREAFFGSCGIVVGRVVEGECSADWNSLKGVAAARVMLEDGTYTTTDRDGLYHFERVCDGTHVVQLDLETLNSELEAQPCIQNTRFAGRSFSQFVDMQGGSLWRADFYTRRKPPVEGPVGIRLSGTLVPGALPPLPQRHSVELHFDSRKAAVTPTVKGELDALLASFANVEVAGLTVLGHTDNVRIAPENRKEFADNQALSEARASAAAEYLKTALSLPGSAVRAEGRGESQPLVSNATAAGRAQNRRVEVIVQPKASSSAPAALSYRLELDGGKVPVAGLKAVMQLPAGVVPKPGSLRIDGKPAADVSVTEGTASFALGDVGANWRRTIEFGADAPAGACQGAGFETQAVALFATTLEKNGRTPSVSATLPCAALAAAAQRTLTEVVHFDSRKAAIRPDDAAKLDALAAAAGTAPVSSLSVVAHADGRRIAPQYRKEFANNQALSEARAESVQGYLDTKLDLSRAQLAIEGRSTTQPIASNRTAKGLAANRRADVTVETGNAAVAAAPTAAASDYASTTVQGKDESAAKKTLMDLSDRRRARLAIADDKTAAGGNTDWLAGQAPGSSGILFPTPGHNPRSNSQRLVVKHAPGSKLRVRVNGTPVDALGLESTQTNAGKSLEVSSFQGLPLADGNNVIGVEEIDAQGRVLSSFAQDVYFANAPLKGEIVETQSIPVADGITVPVLAVRFTDARGKPVRAGVTGPYRLDPPFVAAETVRRQQERQLAGEDSFTPTYKIEGDDGIAYIELQPTTQSGYANLHLSFQQERGATRRQDLRTWMASEARDWVVVGFAEGTVGYNTLDSNTQALAAGVDDKLYDKGQVAFYAKGRVKGEWLATVAYDTRRSSQPGLRQESLQQVIDPDEYYLVYGDGSEQRYDAPSQRRLFVKLERGKFFGLFGDFETGLTQTQLSRYSRALNGFKAEYAGERFAFTAFGANTTQSFVREQLQGNGTSGLYRLGQQRIVINSERITLETRDRLRSELIVTARTLFRHIDYDIDYTNGTLFFKAPVFARDADFNPVFIRAEYEVTGTGGGQNTNAGGRAAVALLGGKLVVGGTFIRDERDQQKTGLGGLDAKLRLGTDTEIRVEAAKSNSQDSSAIDRDGDAWMAEVEHHGKGVDVLAYARRQDQNFGVDQQSGFETGTQKYGVDARVPVTDKLSVNVEGFRQEYLASDATRDAGGARLEYRTTKTGRVYLGGTYAHDEDGGGAEAESTLLNVGASERFFSDKLELSARSDFAVGGGSDESVDFPSRQVLQAGYDVTASTKLIVAQEFTQGDTYDSSTTRVGAISNPWKGAKLNTTLNQDISEYGPRTYAQYGLSQSFLIGKGWGFDIGLDRSDTFSQTGETPVIVNDTGYPLANGGILSGGNGAGGLGSSYVDLNTEDYTAVTAGATYRAESWSAAVRAELRDGEREDRKSLSISGLRQARAGVAVAASARLFDAGNSVGTSGQIGTASLSLAYRPLGSRWSVLQRLEYRHDAITSGTGIPNGGLFGNNSLNVSGSAKSRAIVNHLSFNRVSRRWTAEDRKGNLFNLNQRTQASVYYGAKYSFDEYDGEKFTGFTDLLGLELRHDLTPYIDVGVQASLLHSWEAENYAYSVGPMVGIAPVDNLWVSLGYNFAGFEDRDFDEASYTAQGPYLKARFKFDQLTRLGEAAKSPQAVTPEEAALRAAAGKGGAK